MALYTTMTAEVRGIVCTVLDEAAPAGEWPLEAITVEPPRDPDHGDMATNAAMVLAKPAGMKPRELAERLTPRLAAIDGVSDVAVAGPGFINLRLKPALWQREVGEILSRGTDYGASTMGGGAPVNIEYVSANPTGPLHIGHVRGAVFGDALAALLEKAAYRVTREYYINDAGSQIDTLARSVHQRYRQALGVDIGAIPEGLYPGDYLIPVGQALAHQKGDVWRDAAEAEWLEPIRRFAVEAMMRLIRSDLAAIGIAHEVFFSERTLHEDGRIAETVAAMQAAGLLYVGVLEPPKGKTPDDWEPRPQTLFKATDFGDDVDRALQKSDGSYTYFAADIAYHRDKIARGYTDLINVWGADHGGYVRRMKAAVSALSGGKAALDVKVCQLVRLTRDGAPVKMSKRAGTFITMRELIDEVGPDSVRFMMLTRKNDAPLDFDFAKVAEKSKDNPVWYVHYAHARTFSLARKAGDAGFDFDAAVPDLSPLSHPREVALMRRLADWPRLIEAAARAHEPHRLAFYLYELAAEFHTFWNSGIDDPALRFIIEDDTALSAARLALARAVRIVIASGLGVLGITPLEELG